jgi:hypothetical protein
MLGRERLEMGDDLQPNFVHRFVEVELAAELSAGGLELQSYAVAPYGHAVAFAASPSGNPMWGSGPPGQP